ncbi:OmpA family protein [Sunxiuqinia indica]|uniref:OmpA family protein n=1 Tax=Sunxiuqinia indica TaxID=2692584 RepID=UPI001359891C|nr:OmpA family protein [Sunxiuqinia indica]
MKLNKILNKESRLARFPYKLVVKCVLAGTFILTAVQSPLQAQETQEAKFTKPSWWFGAAGGANFNFHEGTTQQLTDAFMVPTAFHDGQGIGLFVAPLIEFHRPKTMLGFMLQAGYDNRKGSWDQVTTPCNCPADLETGLSYLTVEPSLRIAPFKSNFYIYGGPRLAFNLDKNFLYQQGINPDYPNQPVTPDVDGEFSEMNKSIISMQVGAGYDISLSADANQTQVVLSPFVAFHPYFGQDPRSIESWNLTTVRAGLALKFGRGKKVEASEKVFVPAALIVEPEVTFSVNAPKNIPAERRVRETFPVRNYVFFNEGSTEIPSRYVVLRKDQVKDFSEDQLEVSTPKEVAARSKRQMTVYYNILNILGDRMVDYPNTNVSMTGSSREGIADGKAMAESTKKYLVDVFGIAPARIKTEGRLKPVTPSEQPGGQLELALLREEDRRVSIASNSPELLMEFHSGNDVPLKPVEINAVQEAPLDSYVTFNNAGADEAFSSWSVETKDKQGNVQKFGPYTQESVSIPGKTILGSNPEGTYKMTMIGRTASGKEIKKETTANLVLWTPPVTDEMMRFSVIYEFNNSEAIAMYNKYLTEVVTPKVPKNGLVIIHGHTDVIGDEDRNLNLSTARANDVKAIMEKALAKSNRSDVKFEVLGFGEDKSLAPFNNKFPEERFYNRTVVVDIIPVK